MPKGLLVIVGIAGVGTLLYALLGGSSQTPKQPWELAPTCLRIDGKYTGVVHGTEQCLPITSEPGTCVTSVWGSAYTVYVPIGSTGVDQVTVVHHMRGDSETVSPAEVDMRRGRLSDVTAEEGQVECGFENWIFNDDPAGDIVLFRPNPARWLYFKINRMEDTR